MNAQLAANSRLDADPVGRESKSGEPWASARIVVNLRDTDDAPLLLGLFALGRQADFLCRHSKGELVSVIGRLQRNTRTDGDGNAQEILVIVADSIISARSVQQGGGEEHSGDGQEVC